MKDLLGAFLLAYAALTRGASTDIQLSTDHISQGSEVAIKKYPYDTGTGLLCKLSSGVKCNVTEDFVAELIAPNGSLIAAGDPYSSWTGVPFSSSLDAKIFVARDRNVASYLLYTANRR